jgi:hypothetical protein
MPDVLVSPPWQSKDAKADVVRDLAVPDGPATHLRPGEYAKWVQSWHMAELRTVEALRAFVESGKPMYQHEQFLEGLMSVLGAESVTLVVTLAARQPARNVELLMHVVSPRAMVALAPMLSKTSEAPRVRSHLVAHADVAARGLVPAAVSADAKLRSAARLALRVLATNGKSAVVETVAKELGVPMEELERKTALPLPGKLPEFANAAALPAPIVAKTNAPLPLAAVQNLLAILSVLPKDAPHAIAFDIKAACTAESLDAFVWTLVSDYVLAGANARHDWAVFAAGHLGSDAVARKIDAAARGWTQKKVELMQKSLDVLALIGTDVALSLLYQRGLEAKFEDTQLRARQILEQVAAQRGIAYDELEDRLVPELGLDEGPLVLDYGPRSFEVKLDEQLTPFVVIEGARKEKPPKPVKTDDAAKAKAALERFTTLSDDLSHVARTQLLRLERAMREAREWDASQWSREVVRQPLLRHVATRLVWQVGPKLVRVADDGSLADEADAPYVLSDGQRVRIAHPLDAPKDAWGRMGRVFADYAILQPFAQLGRETFDASREIVGGAKAAWSAVDDLLTGRGWIRTPPENGTVRVLSFPLERFGSPGAFASLQITPGLTIGRVKARPEQTVEKLSLTNATFDALHPRVASEIIRDVVTLSR